MHEDSVDILMKVLALKFHACWVAAIDKFSPRDAGNIAMREWVAGVRDRNIKVGREARTGVDTGKGGQSRYDALLRINGMDVYVELQGRDYNTGHKPVQMQGQVIGLAEVAVGSGARVRYYKVIAEPRRMYRLTPRAAIAGLQEGEYDHLSVMVY